MSTELRKSIRTKIHPFQRQPTYPISWTSEMTFDEIAEYLTPLVIRKYKRFGMYGQDIPDALQNGLMQLWQDLVDDPNFLAEQSKWDAVWYVYSKSKVHLNKYYNKTKIPFTDIADDRGIDVYEYGLRETKLRLNWWDVGDHRARFTHHVDFRIDLVRVMEPSPKNTMMT